MPYNLLTLSGERCVTLCGANVYPQGAYHPDRVLDDHDLLYIREGEWTLAQDEEVYPLRTGDLIFLRAGSHHFSPAPCSVNARTMFIHFTRLPGDRSHVVIPQPAISRYASGREVCLQTTMHCGDEPSIPQLFKEIIDAFWAHRDDQQRRLSLLLSLLLNELSYISSRTPPTPKTDNWLTVLLSALHTDISRFYTLEEAADLAGMQTRTLSSRFRKVMGKSVHQYQLDMKLEMAYSALITGNYTVKQVAENYGFCDPYYFSRVFKKRYNMSPGDLKHGNPAVNIHRPEMH